ncbi:MAG: matrixin family metalloprotease [Myxococcota bacterium]
MRSLIIIVAFLVLAGEQARAEAFRCARSDGNRGPSLRWEIREVPWGVEPTLLRTVSGGRERVLQTVDDAFAAWEGPACSDMAFRFVGADARFVPGFNEQGETRNAIALQQDWLYDADAIAITVSTFTTDGVLLDADIELNGASFDFVLVEDGCAEEQMDLGNVLTHEVGHLLGLAHPPQTPSNRATTMFATSSPCETAKRSLSTGDVEGLCTIYPSSGQTQVCHGADDLGFEVVETEDGFGGCSNLGAGAGISTLGLALFLLLRRLV